MKPVNQTINIGILGFGTVGAGVARLLTENSELIRSRVGADIRLKSVADIDIETDRGVRLAPGILTTDADKVIRDPDIHIIAELIGGEKKAKEFILSAIAEGKQVVTANKALLSMHGNELIRAADEKGTDIAYEASVGGCMPIIKTIRESLVANDIHAMGGILNGTCNYILSKITADGSTFAQALSEAQEKGFAEADPTLDVEGFDTAHKLAILNALAYGMAINLSDIYIEGISHITPLDIEFAREFGYTIKLLAISKKGNSCVEARVHPTMIPSSNLLSNVDGSLNAVTVSADAVEKILLHGHGAGRMPTASAVVADIVDLARNLLTGSSARIPILSWKPDRIRDLPVIPIDEVRTHYYFRFAALDRPGVLSKIAGILGDNQISIKSVHQKGRKTNGAVPIVMLTHLAKEADVKKALQEIEALEVVMGRPVLIRIEEEDGPNP